MASDASFALGTAGLVSPSVQKIASPSSFLDIRNDGWTKQYLPELYEAEVEKYGDRSISGFIQMLGAEMPMASDQVIWSEQGRLHIAYQATVATDTGYVTAVKNIDNTGGSSLTGDEIALRIGNTLVCEVEGVVFKAYVKDTVSNLEIKPYGVANVANLAGVTASSNQTIKLFVYGSEFKKGTNAMTGAIEPNFLSLTNKPMIIKDHFEIAGSDAAQIGWVEVSGENGQSGYLWYLKSQGDTTKRFEDYLEMAVIEAEKSASAADSAIPDGSEGLLSAIGNRGIVATSFFDSESAVADELGDFDALIAELDSQGSISENMLFLDRTSNLHIDDMVAGLNPNISGALNFGAFNNSEDMALNLGFNGFKRGGYEFYKTDWKYLNDKSTRGNVGSLKGVLVPAGTSSVYDQNLGKNVRRPFLHVRYRASEADDRKLKTWITGSVGGASTTGTDNMEVHYLSERCLVVQAANNFVRFDS